MGDDGSLYNFWNDYPSRDVEYVRWYPPTLELIDPAAMWQELRPASGRPLAFYVHVPFCKDICPYCPFNKFNFRSDRANSFMTAVDAEIGLVSAQPLVRGSRVTAGYFGGGTPTALEMADLVHLVQECLDRFNVTADAEISVEANPDTVDLAKLRTLRALGVNRISFGVQSFSDRYLRVIGRTHSADCALAAIRLARQAGFDDVAIDLMYRLPGQSVSDWRHDVDTAVRVGVDHVSTYCLFLDPGTRLYNDTRAGRAGAYPGEPDELAMYEYTQERLAAAGYRHYTINDFALPGRQSVHHAFNWQAPQGSYVGMGPGAFSFVSDGSASYIYCAIHSLHDYLEAASAGRLPVRLGKRLQRDEELSRFMVLGLKFLEVDKAAFRGAFGLALDEVFAPQLALLTERGLVEQDERTVWMTAKGKHYATNVLKAFYTPDNWRKPQPIGMELLAGRGLSMASVSQHGPAGTGEA